MMTGGGRFGRSKSGVCGNGNIFKRAAGKRNIWVIDMVTNMFSTMDSNDLESLKKFLDSKESRIDQYTNAVEYSYQVVPQIYGARRRESPSGTSGTALSRRQGLVRLSAQTV